MLASVTLSIALAGTTPPASANLSTTSITTNAGMTKECVILLHGLGRTSHSMKRLKTRLTREGFDVINVAYPSTRNSVEEIAERILSKVLSNKTPTAAPKVHFVTHSLGSIIVRQYLSTHQLDNLGRVVMFAPPNHGSAVIDRLGKNPLFRRIMGPAALELGTSKNDLPQTLGPVSFECGVIAGDRTLNPILSSFLDGPNDGKVTVDSAAVDGMRDFLVIHSSHTWMMWREEGLRQTVSFLKTGAFVHAPLARRN
jgi:pimeloyl-ACP methyl ester carboxylesterase